MHIKNKDDLLPLEDFLPGILKQLLWDMMVKDSSNQNINMIDSLNIDFDNEYILEKLVKLKKEISVIITRFSNNKYEVYEPIENTHENQILKYLKFQH